MADVFPAYAGMIPVTAITAKDATGVPRICGDDPHKQPPSTLPHMCSPHMRG